MDLSFSNDYNTSESGGTFPAGIYKSKVKAVEIKEGNKGEYLSFDFECFQDNGESFDIRFVKMFPNSPKLAARYRNFCIAFGIGNNIKSLDDFGKGKGYIVLSPRIQERGKNAGKAYLQPIENSAFFSVDKKHASEIKEGLPAEKWLESLKFAEESAQSSTQVNNYSEPEAEAETEESLPF